MSAYIFRYSHRRPRYFSLLLTWEKNSPHFATGYSWSGVENDTYTRLDNCRMHAWLGRFYLGPRRPCTYNGFTYWPTSLNWYGCPYDIRTYILCPDNCLLNRKRWNLRYFCREKKMQKSISICVQKYPSFKCRKIKSRRIRVAMVPDAAIFWDP